MKRDDKGGKGWSRSRGCRRYGFDIDHLVQLGVEALDSAELQRFAMVAVASYVVYRALAAVIADDQRQRRALWGSSSTAGLKSTAVDIRFAGTDSRCLEGRGRCVDRSPRRVDGQPLRLRR